MGCAASNSTAIAAAVSSTGHGPSNKATVEQGAAVPSCGCTLVTTDGIDFPIVNKDENADVDNACAVGDQQDGCLHQHSPDGSHLPPATIPAASLCPQQQHGSSAGHNSTPSQQPDEGTTRSEQDHSIASRGNNHASAQPDQEPLDYRLNDPTSNADDLPFPELAQQAPHSVNMADQRTCSFAVGKCDNQNASGTQEGPNSTLQRDSDGSRVGMYHDQLIPRVKSAAETLQAPAPPAPPAIGYSLSQCHRIQQLQLELGFIACITAVPKDDVQD